MRKIIIISLLLILIGLNGCYNPSSYQDCFNDCRSVHKANFTQEEKVCETLADIFDGKENTHLCNTTNNNRLKEYCYNECK